MGQDKELRILKRQISASDNAARNKLGKYNLIQ